MRSSLVRFLILVMLLALFVQPAARPAAAASRLVVFETFLEPS